jgi:enamine deaminase RidA (YjgF/YER057c/UK114 family)
MSPSSAVDTALAPLPAQPKPRPPTAAELLHHAYGKTDLLSIARIALARGNSHDAILALELTPATNPQYALRNLLLLDQYIQANRLADATKLAGKMSVDDGQYELLIGRLADLQGQARRALDHYQSAIVKASSVRDIKDVRSDALYYTARIYTAQCEASPSAEARAQALNAWLSLKRLHAADPTSERFREANAAMASIK